MVQLACFSPFLYFFLLYQFSSPCFAYPICHPEESFVLLQFKQMLTINSSSYAADVCIYYQAFYPKTISWNKSLDCCTWDGVYCDRRTGHVIRLDLSCSQLQGDFNLINFNSSLFQLSHLQKLNLAFNDFNGSRIPREIGWLTSLTHLNLSVSNFSGQIPSEISHLSQLVSLDISTEYSTLEFEHGRFESLIANLSKLEVLSLPYVNISSKLPTNLSSFTYLDLFGTGLHGKLPDCIFNLPKLQTVILGGNPALTGPLPQVNSSSTLKHLSLSGINISEKLPDSIGYLKSLNILSLYGCHLMGSIPKSIGNRTEIDSLDLGYNNFTGQFPSTITNLTQITTLYLDSNSLTGPLPNNANGLQKLEVFWIRRNLINGTISSWLFSLPLLTALHLDSNHFTGAINELKSKWSDSLSYLNLSYNILTSIDQLPWKKLRFLDLKYNLLEGQLRESVCDLDMLEILNLSNNNFTGEIPQCLGNLSNLSVLDLRRNRFHGMIPPFAQGSQLRNIGLNGNNMEGPVPQSLANCKGLEVFDVGYNNINDTFPWWLESLPELQVLVLKFNKFHGSLMTSSTLKTILPFPKLRIFDVSGNQFSGLLPVELLKHFDAMKDASEKKIGVNYMGSNFSNVYYKDSVNVTIKGVEIELVKILTIFTTIDLSCNKFQGEILESIGYLHSLRLLNLSHNNLIGEIPSILGNLGYLESLDLSWNQLQGKIPMELTKLTFLAVLNLSQNHLAGRIPRGYQFETFGNDSYLGNLELCGFPLSKDCESTEPTSSPMLQDENESEFLNGFSWSAVLMGYGCGTVFGLAMGFLVFLFGKPKWLFGILEGATCKLQRQKGRVRHRHVSIVH